MLTLPVRLPLGVGTRLLSPARSELRRRVRRSLGVPGEPPVREMRLGRAFLPPEAVARQVHADLPAMVVGGLAALFLQSLHPLAMAGVAEHSNYRQDTIGRLRRTATFIGATTFGTREEAAQAIEEVRHVHRRVHGRAPDGRPYSANDPELLTWVHVAEVHCFFSAAQRFGPSRFSPREHDRYLSETAVVARSLGARWVPESGDEVTTYFGRVRPELFAGPQAIEARDFLLRGVASKPNDRVAYAIILAAALAVLPDWARDELHVPSVPLVEALLVAPAARALCSGLRWAISA